MKNVLAKIGVAATTSIIVCENVNLNPLWNALITFAISLVSVLSIEGLSLLKSWFVNRKKKLDKETEEVEEKNNEKEE